MGAINWEVDITTRKTTLEGFAKSFGVHPPRNPVPKWWEEFEKWYQEVRTDEYDDNLIGLRTEAFGYTDSWDETYDPFNIENYDDGRDPEFDFTPSTEEELDETLVSTTKQPK